jgi:dihydroorotate dehydrogenase (fumarate)
MGIGKSRAGAILTKSTTPQPREGNILPRSIPVIELGGGCCEGSLNSEGLPNMGFDYYTNSAMVEKMAAFGKPYILSIGGLYL